MEGLLASVAWSLLARRGARENIAPTDATSKGTLEDALIDVSTQHGVTSLPELLTHCSDLLTNWDLALVIVVCLVAVYRSATWARACVRRRVSRSGLSKKSTNDRARSPGIPWISRANCWPFDPLDLLWSRLLSLLKPLTPTAPDAGSRRKTAAGAPLRTASRPSTELRATRSGLRRAVSTAALSLCGDETVVEPNCATGSTGLYRAMEHRPLQGGASHGGMVARLQAERAAASAPSPRVETPVGAPRRELDGPSKVRRAGPHIWRQMRASGTGSARTWLRHFAHASLLRGPRANALWSTAWCIDSKLRQAGTEVAQQQVLENDLGVELGLRTLGAAEMQARGRVTPQEAQYMSSTELMFPVVPAWLHRAARRAGRAERTPWRRLDSLAEALLNPVQPRDRVTLDPEQLSADARAWKLSGGKAVDAWTRCQEACPARSDGKRWRVKGESGQAFPLPEELQELAGSPHEQLFPIPALTRPTGTSSRSHRSRKRAQVRIMAWKDANRYLMTLNALRRGVTSKQTRCWRRDTSQSVTPAQRSAQVVALQEATRLALVRLSSRQSAQPVAKLINSIHANL